MNLNWIFSFFFLLSLLLPPSAAAKTLQGQVIKVFDGDSFLVRVQGREEYVRLREIDAPEVSRRKQAGQEPWGQKGREFARSKVKDKKVRLEVEERDERDQYQRLLAYVFVGELFVNQEMIQSGNAFFYPGPFRGKYAARLERAEEVAREKGVGVWDRKNGLPERPREFRSRTQREENLFPSLNNLLGRDKKIRPFQEIPAPQDKIVGNKRTMVYHLPGSSAAPRVNPKNRVFFDSPEEAEKAGFRRARSYS